MADTTALAKADYSKMTLRQILDSDSFKQTVATALPRHCSADRMIRVAVTAINRSPKLAECTKASFFDCMSRLTQFGLEPDGRRAHLIPFQNSKKVNGEWVKVYECTLVLDYKGVVELVMRSGQVANVYASVVCENDDFEFDTGVVVKHKINWKNDRGAPYAVYCIITRTDGYKQADCMSVHEVNRVRDNSQGYQSFKKGWTKTSPWEGFWDEMAKKTCFKRLSKWIPWAVEVREAIDYDDDDGRVVEHAPKSNLPAIGFEELGDVEETEQPLEDAPKPSKTERLASNRKKPAPDPEPSQEPASEAPGDVEGNAELTPLEELARHIEEFDDADRLADRKKVILGSENPFKLSAAEKGKAFQMFDNAIAALRQKGG